MGFFGEDQYIQMVARRLLWSATQVIPQVEAEIRKPGTRRAGVGPSRPKGAKKNNHLGMGTGLIFAKGPGTAPGQWGTMPLSWEPISEGALLLPV